MKSQNNYIQRQCDDNENERIENFQPRLQDIPSVL